MLATIAVISRTEMVRAEFPIRDRRYIPGDVVKTIEGLPLKTFEASETCVTCAPVFLLSSIEKFVGKLKGRILNREDLCPPPRP